MSGMIDAYKLIDRLTEIRDRPFIGERGKGTYQRKFDLNSQNRDRITQDIRVILKMVKENGEKQKKI